MTESTFHLIRIFNVVARGVPAVEFTAEGDLPSATGEIDISQLDIYAPHGPGMVLRAKGAAQTINNFRVSQLRIEGLEGNADNSQGDLLQIGDSRFGAASPRGLSFSQTELLDPYPGFCAVRFDAPNARLSSYSVVMDSLMIGGGTSSGCGINVQAGRNLLFRVYQMNTKAANVIVGASSKV